MENTEPLSPSLARYWPSDSNTVCFISMYLFIYCNKDISDVCFNGKSEQVFNTLLVFASAFAVVLNSHDGSFPPIVAKAHFKGSTVEVGMGIPSLCREPSALLARLT